jgi:hypothetical protein
MAPANGQLVPELLRPVGQGLFLQHEAAEAFTLLCEHVRHATGQALRLDAAYRTLAKQRYLYDGHARGLTGFGAVAVPGRSSHGWGLAVDLYGHDDRALIDRYGEPFGWSAAWSDAPGEPRHMLFNATVWRANRESLTDHFAVLLQDERQWLSAYLELRRNETDRAERRRLWRKLLRRRRDIWRQAQRGGWEASRRRERYALIHYYIGG